MIQIRPPFEAQPGHPPTHGGPEPVTRRPGNAFRLQACSAVDQCAAGVIQSPVAKLRGQLPTPPFDGRLLQHPAAQDRLAPGFPCQLPQLVLLERREVTLMQKIGCQLPPMRLEIDADRPGGPGQQQAGSTVAETHPAVTSQQPRRPAGGAVEGNGGGPGSQQSGQPLPQQCSAAAVTPADGGGERFTPGDLLGRQATR